MASILAWKSDDADPMATQLEQPEAGEAEEASEEDSNASDEEELEAQMVQIPMLLKTIAEENEANECWCGVLFWLINAAFYILVLDSQFRISASFEVSQALKDSVSSMSTPDGLDMDGVTDYNSLWDWISNAAVPAIYDFTDYADENLDAWDRNYLGEYNRVVGGIFLLQDRGARFDSTTCETAHTSFFPVCYTGEQSEVPYGVSCKETTEWPKGSGEFPYKDGYCDSAHFDKAQVLLAMPDTAQFSIYPHHPHHPHTLSDGCSIALPRPGPHSVTASLWSPTLPLPCVSPAFVAKTLPFLVFPLLASRHCLCLVGAERHDERHPGPGPDLREPGRAGLDVLRSLHHHHRAGVAERNGTLRPEWRVRAVPVLLPEEQV